MVIPNLLVKHYLEEGDTMSGQTRLTREGYLVPKSHIAMIETCRSELRVQPVEKGAVQTPKAFDVYKETDSFLIVPKFWGIQTFGQPHTDDLTGSLNVQPITLQFQGTLRESLNQPEAAMRVLAQLKSHGGGVLSLPTGHGKTMMALYIASKLGVKTLIVVHKAFLMDQFTERIRTCFPTARVTYIRGNVIDTSGDIVIAMIQTLISREYRDIYSSFGFLVVDGKAFAGEQLPLST